MRFPLVTVLSLAGVAFLLVAPTQAEAAGDSTTDRVLELIQTFASGKLLSSDQQGFRFLREPLVIHGKDGGEVLQYLSRLYPLGDLVIDAGASEAATLDDNYDRLLSRLEKQSKPAGAEYLKHFNTLYTDDSGTVQTVDHSQYLKLQHELQLLQERATKEARNSPSGLPSSPTTLQLRAVNLKLSSDGMKAVDAALRSLAKVDVVGRLPLLRNKFKLPHVPTFDPAPTDWTSISGWAEMYDMVDSVDSASNKLSAAYAADASRLNPSYLNSVRKVSIALKRVRILRPWLEDSVLTSRVASGDSGAPAKTRLYITDLILASNVQLSGDISDVFVQELIQASAAQRDSNILAFPLLRFDRRSGSATRLTSWAGVAPSSLAIPSTYVIAVYTSFATITE